MLFVQPDMESGIVGNFDERGMLRHGKQVEVVSPTDASLGDLSKVPEAGLNIFPPTKSKLERRVFPKVGTGWPFVI